MSEAISALVNIVHKYEGEVVKIAGDCLICIFVQEAQDEDDEEEFFQRAKLCARDCLTAIKETNENLDLHGGLDRGNIQRMHLKELKGSSPRSNSARSRLKEQQATMMNKSELEASRQRWFLIAGRPIKVAGSLLDKAPAGSINVYGGQTITRDTSEQDLTTTDVNMETEITRRKSSVDVVAAAELSLCPEIADSYLPPIVREKKEMASI